MTERKARPAGSRRAVKAALLVAAVIGTVPIADAVFCAVGAGHGTVTTSGGIDAAPVMQASNVEDALENLEELANGGVVQTAVPDAVEREVGFLPGARDVRVGAEGQVIGYMVDGDAAAVLAQLGKRMESLDWKGVPLGGLDGATFLKESGEHTWALVTCTQSGSATCVVVRLNQKGASPLVR